MRAFFVISRNFEVVKLLLLVSCNGKKRPIERVKYARKYMKNSNNNKERFTKRQFYGTLTYSQYAVVQMVAKRN